MSYDNLDPEELAAAKQQVEQYGERSKEIVKELIESCVTNDHHRGGALVREIYDEPDKLMLVIGMLTTAVVRTATGPMATPQDLGIDPADLKPKAWEISATDQIQAAAAENDVDAFSKIALDAQIKAFTQDFREHMQENGHYPDVQSVMRAFMLMDRVTVVALGAEALRRLVIQEVEHEGR